MAKEKLQKSEKFPVKDFTHARRVKGQVKSSRIQSTVIKKHNKVQQEAAYELAVEDALTFQEGGGIQLLAGERSKDLKQDLILEGIDLGTAEKVLDLRLNLGPYTVDVSADGQHLLLGGQKGDVTMINLMGNHLIFQKNLQETIRDIKFCFNENFWVAAQKKYVSVYDKQCTEIHCFRHEQYVHKIDYLPLHFLLVSIGEFGVLRYRDIATGEIVATHKTRLGSCRTMAYNPYNAVVQLGHSNGTVTMWTPTVSKPVVTLSAHKGGVTAVCSFRDFYMATAGHDGVWRVWDIRKAEQSLSQKSYCGQAPSTMDTAQSGLLAVGNGCHVEIWKDAELMHSEAHRLPYVRHDYRNGQTVTNLKFRPYEDLLAVGHSLGLSTLLVPGAGHATPDSLSDNPYTSAKAKSRRLVRNLIDKLPSESIVFDPQTLGRYRVKAS